MAAQLARDVLGKAANRVAVRAGMPKTPVNLPEKSNKSLVAIGQALAGMVARAVTVGSIARTEHASSREINKEVTRKT